FFSSRRRHTRFSRDWSSDVCSSDLYRGRPAGTQVIKTEVAGKVRRMEAKAAFQGPLGNATVVQRSRSSAQHHHSIRFSEETQERSEERRVGKECRSGVGATQYSRRG